MEGILSLKEPLEGLIEQLKLNQFSTTQWVIAFIGAFIFVQILLNLIASGKQRNHDLEAHSDIDRDQIYLYDPIPFLMTSIETEAFKDLYILFNKLAHVCPKVRIADILRSRPIGNFYFQRAALAKIAQKHVDFAIMDFDGRVLLAVEIDDSTHNRPDRVRRDRFVNHAFASAGVTLLRIKPGEVNSCSELKAEATRLLEVRSPTPQNG